MIIWYLHGIFFFSLCFKCVHVSADVTLLSPLDLIPLLYVPIGERGPSRAGACNCSFSRNSFMVWWISFSVSVAQLHFWEPWRPVHPFMALNHGYKLPGGRVALVAVSRDTGIGADTDGFCVSVCRGDVMADDSWAISLCVNNLCTFRVEKIMDLWVKEPNAPCFFTFLVCILENKQFILGQTISSLAYCDFVK